MLLYPVRLYICNCPNYFGPCRFCFGGVAALMSHVCYYYFLLPAFLFCRYCGKNNSRQVRVSIVVVEFAGFVELTLPFFVINQPHFFRQGSTVMLPNIYFPFVSVFSLFLRQNSFFTTFLVIFSRIENSIEFRTKGQNFA